ncbi:MAG: hypothetical protein EOR25_29725 [Mesorhizobium sp.]|uniref:hypothetical protein n=1 Tax=Mesorhizobium sp. TaxID=1871066 RepID=UPI000FE30EA9|nr:hypothetical protein [Mesorhizobium sp.]RWJ04842.1 MAG: hypothetical protein EOR24_29630 [Mesorhizobium sp.]RWJ12006.1 MAG: hypothetical protein EOR25_29725 [Mesorhizobium sp.]
MKLLRAGITLAALSGLVCAGTTTFAADRTLTPEQTANLYLRTFINGDFASAIELDHLLSPEFPVGNMVDLNAFVSIIDASMAWVTSPPDQRRTLTEALAEFRSVLIGSVQRSQCSATNSKVVPNAKVKGHFIATVSYECLVPDISGASAEAGDWTNMRADLKAGKLTAGVYHTISQAFRTAPLTCRISGSMNLYASPDKKLWWTSDTPKDTWALILEAMLLKPMQSKPCKTDRT